MNVVLPSGETLTDIPEGTTRAQIIAKLKANGHDTTGLEPAAPPESTATSVAGGVAEPVLSMTSGALAAPIAGIAGLVAGGVGKVANALGLTNKSATDIAGDTTRGVQDALTYKPQTQGGQAVTNAVSKPFDWLTNKADQAGGAVTDFTGSPLAGTATNAFIQALPQLALEGVKAVPATTLRPVEANPTAMASAARLAQQGVDLTPAQASGNTALKMTNAALDRLPISSGMQDRFAKQQRAQAQTAINATAGIVGPSADSTALGAAKARLGNQFDTLAANNTVSPAAVGNLTNDLGAKLTQVQREVGASGDQAVIRNKVDDILDKVTPVGTIPGEAYKSLDSDLGRVIRNTGSPDVKTHLGDIRDSLRQAMDASISPQDQAAWGQARTQYYNLQRIAAAADTASGNISIPKLLQNIKTFNKASVFDDSNQLANLAKDLKNTIGNTEPNSGTAGRLEFQHYLTGGIGGAALFQPSALGALAIPPIAQKIVNSNAMRNLATNGVTVGGGGLSALDKARILANIQAARAANQKQE